MTLAHGHGNLVSSLTPKPILGAGSVDRPQDAEVFVPDPAYRTYVVSPERDLVIRKALMRVARRCARRALLRKIVLDFQYLCLKSRYALLRFRRRLLG